MTDVKRYELSEILVYYGAPQVVSGLIDDKPCIGMAIPFDTCPEHLDLDNTSYPYLMATVTPEVLASVKSGKIDLRDVFTTLSEARYIVISDDDEAFPLAGEPPEDMLPAIGAFL